MITMSTWKQVTVDVLDALHLDPRNVRLGLPESTPEADIIHDLFRNEKALALVESICKVGLLTHELPIAVKRNNRLVVVEGNRRVAALKAIQNPFLAPEHRARIERMVSSLIDRDSLRKVTVKLAPSQDDANQLIAAIHTGNQRVGWSPARQAAFFQAQIDAGKSAEYLISHYPTVDVKKFIIRSKLLDLFQSVNYSDPQLKDLVTARSFPVSVLARLYDNDGFLQLVQIDVDETNAQVRLRSSRRRFAKVAERIVSDIKSKKINTRVLNSAKSDGYKGYMDELRDLLSDHDDGDDDLNAAPVNFDSSNGSPPSIGSSGVMKERARNSASGTSPDSTPASGEQAEAKDVTKPRGRTSHYLNAETIKIAETFPPSIHKIHAELCQLNIRKYPNATLDLLRTFLEKSIKAYADNLNEEIRRNNAPSNGGVQPNGFIQLGHCLNWLEEYLKGKGKRPFVQVVAKIRGNKLGGYIPTADHMNAINHNHEVFATADDVRECWECMEGLLRMMLKP